MDSVLTWLENYWHGDDCDHSSMDSGHPHPWLANRKKILY